MKKLAFLTVLVVAFAMMSGIVMAAETPHGPFDGNSAVCAACHRAHTSSAEYLLATPRVTGLCIGCHDGSGADTDVINGVFVVNGTEVAPHEGYNHGTWGSATSSLMAGGFTAVSGTATSSKHMDPTDGMATTLFQYQWGKKTTTPVTGEVGPSGGYTKTFLDCVDCHMPHRSRNYRMLRMKPTGYDGDELLVPTNDVVSEGVVSPTALNETNDYTAGTYGRRYTEDNGMWNTKIGAPTDPAASISKWCGKGCHDFYYDAALKGASVDPRSPAMTQRLNVTYNALNTLNVELKAIGSIAVNTVVYIKGVKYTVMGVTDNTITLSSKLMFDAATECDPTHVVTAGTPVAISGAGMGVYYEVDPVAGSTVAQPNFTHAIDVDLVYYPRNSAGLLEDMQDLSDNLDAASLPYSNKMPVASTNQAYDSADYLTCATCHRAHGTDVFMDPAKEAALAGRSLSDVTAPAGNTAATNGSMLLRLDNRAVCQQCHQMPRGF